MTGPSGNFRIVAMCLGMVLGMAGLTYASVPLYRIFCQVTGYGGTTQRAGSVEGIEIIDRLVTVRFDANTASDLHWRFRPLQREVSVRLGEKITISYMAENLSNRPITGMAVFNVTPQSVGAYFNKIECFCFTDTRIEPGETLEMPVVFFVDPELDQEQFLKTLKTITLSYIFYTSDEDTGDEKPQVKPQAKIQQQSGESADRKL